MAGSCNDPVGCMKKSFPTRRILFAHARRYSSWVPMVKGSHWSLARVLGEGHGVAQVVCESLKTLLGCCVVEGKLT